jgi:hypothetical protein
MEKLNLPTFDFKITDINGVNYIFDIFRKKNIVLTPEEWVRQHFLLLLINQYKYPKSLIKLEGGLHYEKLEKRTDIVVLDRYGEPFMLVECKKATVKIDDKVLKQATIYNKIIQSKYIVLTNGLKTLCFETTKDSEKIVQLSDLPAFT